MRENLENTSLPLEFGTALAQNPQALARFSALSSRQRRDIVRGAEMLRSAGEMRAYISAIGSNNGLL